MASILLLCQALVAPLVATASAVWMVRTTWLATSTGRGLHVSEYVLPLCLGFIALKWQTTNLKRRRFERKARSLGCQPAKTYPHQDPVLGLDFFVATVRGLKQCTLLDDMDRLFRSVGDTFWFLSLGRWMMLTDEPDNIKTILALNMDDWPIAGPRLWSLLPILGSQSVFASNGAVWHRARSMIRPAFVRDQVADLACSGRHIANLIAKIPRDGEAFDLQQLILPMTMDSSTDFM
jgi:hypothetical protein